MNTKIVDVKEFNNDKVGILVEVVLIEMMIIFAILNLINEAFLPALYVIISMILFTMAYNNIKMFKKKYMTPIYIIIGFFVLITTFLEYM